MASTTGHDGKATVPKGQFRPGGTRFLPNAEHARRRRENLCFAYGGPYGAEHKCPEGSLSVVILGANEEISEEGEIKLVENRKDQDFSTDEDELNAIELSLITSKGLSQPRTMKLLATINGVGVLVLIDSGATHNFISNELVEKLGLSFDSEGIFSVKLGHGKRKNMMGKCRGIQLKIDNYSCSIDALVFELGGVDLILGISWLATLGKYRPIGRTLQ